MQIELQPKYPETHLYLVRHGQTEFNKKRIVQGRGVNTPLNELGRKQAQALASRFSELVLNRIYCSPLARASQTAAYVSHVHPGIPFRYDSRLEEMSWGTYEGQHVSPTLAAAFDDMKMRWHRGDFQFKVPGGESLKEVQERGMRAIQSMLDEHAGERILVVAHGRFLRILLASLLETYGIRRMEEIAHSNTGVNHLVVAEGRIRALQLNCTRHLEEASLIRV